eukprot:NODE_512_length_2977_cov_3.645965.p1 GENE.NODE_512_length_2977_cov_3.645965~~NODE_512_length_2977_cov_3.645965.p1  ORF type:complete len:903 (-),score=211.62 NODE_512_length_2977_cov_3.645965:173-2881(-)
MVAVAPKGSSTSASNADEECLGELVVLHIISAQLTHSREGWMQKMDPATSVHWASAKEPYHEISRTSTAWNAHMTPHWDHWCVSHPYAGNGGGDSVAFHVIEVDWLVNADERIIGLAEIPVSDLLSGVTLAPEQCAAPGAVYTLPLLHDRYGQTGTFEVQAVLIRPPRNGGPAGPFGEAFTMLSGDMFETPVSAKSVSGGSAPFYSLTLREPMPGQSRHHYIGKDLMRASDEVGFYERLLEHSRDPSSGFASMVPFTFEYRGIFVADVASEGQQPSNAKRQLIVLRNLFDRAEQLRMVDIKIGSRTGQAGWHGKSSFAALRQGFLDHFTNSTHEGFRLEGFEGAPPVVRSHDPLLDVSRATASLVSSAKVSRKARRASYQRMRAVEVFSHLLDVHQEPASLPDAELELRLTPTELAELVCHEFICQLFALAKACRHVEVPQKWLGSSVALGFDAGRLPPRPSCKEDETNIRRTVRVNIFDWGRSELNTVDLHSQLSAHEQRDRKHFWHDYVCGIDRLLWEVACAYRHTFAASHGWKEVSFKVYDFDSISAIDFMAKVRVPLVETPMKTVQMKSSISHRCVCAIKCSAGMTTLTYSITWRALPTGSRLAGVWRVTLLRVNGLHRADMKKGGMMSDPLCIMRVVADDEPRVSMPFGSCVQLKTLDPLFDETFELPVAATDGVLEAVLADAVPAACLPRLLSAGHGAYYISARFEWRSGLDRAAAAAAARASGSGRIASASTPGTAVVSEAESQAAGEVQAPRSEKLQAEWTDETERALACRTSEISARPKWASPSGEAAAVAGREAACLADDKGACIVATSDACGVSLHETAKGTADSLALDLQEFDFQDLSELSPRSKIRSTHDMSLRPSPKIEGGHDLPTCASAEKSCASSIFCDFRGQCTP